MGYDTSEVDARTETKVSVKCYARAIASGIKHLTEIIIYNMISIKQITNRSMINENNLCYRY